MVLTVAKELRKLTNEPLDGIKVLLNEEDVTDVVAELEGPGQLCPRPSCGACAVPARWAHLIGCIVPRAIG